MGSSSKGEQPQKNLTSTMEDYLETIFDLDIDKKAIRVKDIAKRLNVKMPTVTSMLRVLSERGFINYEKYEFVELTDHGASIGKEMRRRHEVLLKFLTEVLKIEYGTANEEACKMEHTFSNETMESLTDFIEFLQSPSKSGENVARRFENFRRSVRAKKTD